MDMNLEQGLSYDDVLLRPQHSNVESRSDPELTTTLVGDIEIDVPVISAPMDTVTESEMSQTLSDNGAVGIIHRFLPANEQAEEISKVDGTVGAAIGIDDGWRNRVEQVLDAGADFLCVDVAHAHATICLEVVSEISENYPDVPLMAGNVSTGEGAVDLADAGADTVKVGIGPGSHCLTREVAGVGVPQVTAISEVSDALDKARGLGKFEHDVSIVADGGIQNSGDMSKALVLGADTVMIGGLFGGCLESPAPVVESDGVKYKITRGMASGEAREDNGLENDEAVEGDSGLTEVTGSAESLLTELASGTRTSFSYLGAHSVEEARENGEFLRVSPSVQQRNGTHGVFIEKRE